MENNKTIYIDSVYMSLFDLMNKIENKPVVNVLSNFETFANFQMFRIWVQNQKAEAKFVVSYWQHLQLLIVNDPNIKPKPLKK